MRSEKRYFKFKKHVRLIDNNTFNEILFTQFSIFYPLRTRYYRWSKSKLTSNDTIRALIIIRINSETILKCGLNQTQHYKTNL